MQLPSTFAQMTSVAIGVDRLAGADHARPPAGFAGARMHARHMLVPGQRMTDQYRIRRIGVQRAVRLVRDRDRRQHTAAIERERSRAA